MCFVCFVDFCLCCVAVWGFAVFMFGFIVV